MTCSSVYLTDLTCSERLTIWTIRHTAAAVSSASACKRQNNMFLPCFQQEFVAISNALHKILTRMTALKMPSLDICSGNTLSLTTTEHALLIATEAVQNERNSEARTLLHSFLPLPSMREHMMFALTTLSACLAGSGHWLSPQIASPPQHSGKTQTLKSAPQIIIASGAVLSLRRRWHKPDSSPVRVSWPVTGEFHLPKIPSGAQTASAC